MPYFCKGYIFFFYKYYSSNLYTITFDAADNGSAAIVMTDIHGRTVASHTAEVVAGTTSTPMSGMHTLNAGIYFVKITVNNESQILKLIKQ